MQLKQQGVALNLTDDDINNKLVVYLNKEFSSRYFATETIEKSLPTIDKKSLLTKLHDDTDLTGPEFQALQKLETTEYDALQKNFSMSKAHEYLSLYTRDEALAS